MLIYSYICVLPAPPAPAPAPAPSGTAVAAEREPARTTQPPLAGEVCGLKLPVYETLSYQCMRHTATSV
jgi:hypothetical protein